MDENLITVYCKVDERNRITSVDSSIFIQDLADWLELDNSDSGSRANRDAYALAQGNYFPGSLTDDAGSHRYLYDATHSPKYRDATPEEMQAERDAMPPSPPTESEEVNTMLLDLDYRLTLTENGIKEGDLV